LVPADVEGDYDCPLIVCLFQSTLPMWERLKNETISYFASILNERFDTCQMKLSLLSAKKKKQRAVATAK
jgi:hypothetical protein